MDFEKCFEILNNRTKEVHDQSCPCCTQPRTQPQNPPLNKNETIAQDPNVWKNEFELEWSIIKSQLKLEEHSTLERLAAETSFDLLQQIVLIQQFRIKIYQFYARELNSIIARNTLQQYPLLCSQITEYFSVLSKHMLKIKVVLEEKSLLDVVKSIVKIQHAEKEKLMFIAALHLDQIQKKLPPLEALTGGGDEIQRSYLQKKIEESEVVLREELDNIQCHKADLLDA